MRKFEESFSFSIGTEHKLQVLVRVNCQSFIHFKASQENIKVEIKKNERKIIELMK